MPSETDVLSLSLVVQQPGNDLVSAADDYLLFCLQRCDRPTVEEFAKRICISERHVRRLFQTHLKMPPRTYFDLWRRATAAELRRHGTRPLEISLRLGFSNTENYLRFNRAAPEEPDGCPKMTARFG